MKLRTGLLAMAATLAACGGGEPRLNQPPIAQIEGELVVAPGQRVELRGDRSFDPDGTIVKHLWDLGDGTTAEGPIVAHAWERVGFYAVTLLVEDDLRATGTAAARITVTDGTPDNLPPTAVIDGPGRGAPGEPLEFSGAGSSDRDGTIVAHRWDFGDGQRGDGVEVSHTFHAEGTFTVTLVVEDDRGGLGQATRTVIVSAGEANRPPVAVAGQDVTTRVNAPVTFDGAGSTDPDGSIVAYRWDLGDGTRATTRRVTHTYQSAGTFTVTLEVEDDRGARATDTLTATVLPLPSYDGRWLLNPTAPSLTCSNAMRTYAIPFPAGELQLSGSTADTASGQLMGGVELTGRVDREGAVPALSLRHEGPETHPVCGLMQRTYTLNAQLPTETTLDQGRFTVVYMSATDPYCNCARTFDVTGARR